MLKILVIGLGYVGTANAVLLASKNEVVCFDLDPEKVNKINNKACVQVFFFRSWRNLGNKSYFPGNTEDFSENEILDTFIPQFYQNKPIPKLILVSHEIKSNSLLSKAFSKKEKSKEKQDYNGFVTSF